MIRYLVTADELRADIQAHNPSWLGRAEARTQAFEAAGRYDKNLQVLDPETGKQTAASEIWGDIKAVYMARQSNKCAYCERLLAGPDLGERDHAVEHFRPKSSVKAWPPASRWPPGRGGKVKRRKLAYSFATGGDVDPGYYALAYEPLNYADSCHVCNSGLKSNYFPIAGVRSRDDRAGEQHLLIYPIGDVEIDPETLITFNSVIPRPVSRDSSSHEYRRALVTIEFFCLDREDLWRERAEQIRNVWAALIASRSAEAADRAYAETTLKQLTDPSSPHSSCARAFRRLCDTAPEPARLIAGWALAYVGAHARRDAERLRQLVAMLLGNGG